MNNIFLISFALLLIGGQLGRIQLNGQLAIYLHEWLILIYFLFNLAGLKKLFLNLKKINKKEKIIFLALSVNVLVASIFAIFQGSFALNSVLYTLRFLAYLVFIALLKQQFSGQKIQSLFLKVSLAWAGLGLLQYFFLPDLTSLYYLGFDDHFYRLTSTMLDPGFLGLILVFNLLFYLSRKPFSQKNLLFGLLFLVTLLLTYSRASYLSCLISAGYLFFCLPKGGRFWLTLFMVLMLISLPFLPKQSGGEGVKLERSSTIEARFINAREFLAHNQKLAIFIGQGSFQPHYQPNEEGIVDHAHFADNLLVFLYNSFGLFGASLLIYFLAIKTRQLSKKQQYFSLAILIAWLMHSQFHSDITQGFVMLTFWGLMTSSTTDETRL